ncbi:MAG TPA: ion channel [Rhodanobacteraceae bacterium]
MPRETGISESAGTGPHSGGRVRRITVNVGPTRVTKLDASGFEWHDAFHAIMSASWPTFFGSAVAIYLVANLVFAAAYYIEGSGISNASSFLDYFFFSVQTLATVGYGNMSPTTRYANWVATAEIITGMLSTAIITSLVFARFSRPTARILFSKVAVITPYAGVPTLMLRVANERRSYILQATASLALMRDEETFDGHSLRRFFDLKLERANSPMFALSWLLMHRIDETSPLHGVTAKDIEDGDMRFAITISGVDETFAAGVTARHQYSYEDILFDRRFADIFSEGEDARHVYQDMSRFHELEPNSPRGD